MHADNEALLFVGTFTQGTASRGIYIYSLDRKSGALNPLGAEEAGDNPAYLALDPGNNRLFAVNEIADFEGREEGSVSSFSIDRERARLTLTGRSGSGGRGPCHLDVHADGTCVAVANYGGGSVALLPVGADGGVKQATSVHQHEGSSVNPDRQQGPHAHSITFDPSGRFALACDLGVDKVFVYRIEESRKLLVPNDPPSVSVSPGVGPRHLCFHPTPDEEGNLRVYVINELGSSVCTFTFGEKNGLLELIDTVSTLPGAFGGESFCADIHVTPDGRFLYGSNRGHDSVAIFSVEEGKPPIRFLGCESTGGKTPRGFAVDPSGEYLLAANQDSDNIVVFRIDRATGRLADTGHRQSLPRPVCIKFL